MKNRFLSGLLAFVLAFAGPAALAVAQDAPAAPPAPAPSKDGGVSEVFVITRDESGETLCRVATAAERRQLALPQASRPGRVLIYPGGRRPAPDGSGAEVTGPNVTETGTPLLPSAGLRIVLHGTSQLNGNVAARDAFIVAANRWEARISTQITVVLDVDFGSTFFGTAWSSPNVLGATGTAETQRRYSSVRQQLLAGSPGPEEAALYNALPASVVPVELNNTSAIASSVRLAVTAARALGLTPDIANPDAVPLGSGDARIGFNSAHTFDFNPNDGITAGSTDFDAVVVHEIGHALGFISESGADSANPMSVLDLFRFRPGAATVGSLSTAPRVMSKGGTQVYFNNRTNSFGSNEMQLATGGPTGSSTGGGDGDQSSHWKDDRYVSFIGIMDPRLPRGRREVINNNDLLAFDSFGYKIDGTPALPPSPPVPLPPPANDNFANAFVLQGSTGAVTGDNFDATRQPGEPDPARDPGTLAQKSVWYRWTAPAGGEVTMDTVGSDFDTSLGAYTGGNFNALTPAGPNSQNDDITPNVDRTSRINFTAAAGATYHIQVNGWNSEVGAFRLNWTAPGGPAPTPTPTPAQTTIQFEGAAFSALERDNTAGILVTRAGDLSQAHTVTYQTTSAGTATPGADYMFATGSVTFAAGDDHEVLAVQLHNDTAVEPSETVVIQLGGAPAGVGFGPNNPTTLTIQDDDTFPANSVRIAGAASQPVAESAGQIEIAVTRSGDLSAPASVVYRTFDSTALSQKDYTFAGGTLAFAAGEATKTFPVLITEDFFDEPEERLNVELSNAIGTTVDLAQPLIQVAIQDDDPPGLTTNPNDRTTDFVTQHYKDFLNRVPDEGGLGFWSAGIDVCGADAQCRQRKRVDTSAAFFLSIEFQETGYLVYRLYKAAYGNAAGTPVPVRFQEFMTDTQEIGRGVIVGAQGWDTQLELNKQAFAHAFVTRGRFKTAYPAGLTPAQFVDSLDFNAGTVLTAAQRTQLIGDLTANNTDAGRAGVLRQIAENQALRDNEFRKAFVLMQYFGYLRRNPNEGQDVDFNGYFHWLSKLDEFNGDWRRAEMVRAFIESIEYRQRFGQ